MTTSDTRVLFSEDTWLPLAANHADAYQSADPFPHVVLDDFLPDDVAQQLVAEFPGPDAIEWLRFKDSTGVKLAANRLPLVPPVIREVLLAFNSAPFIAFLERLTGIDGLIPDPWYVGGGMHQISRGGFLKIHADFNRHEQLRLDRRINVLLYLNPDWQNDYGGNLELWNRDMSSAVVSTSPVLNRCVIFNTTDVAFHGHPDPLNCPEGLTRKSLALYYYSNGRPDEEVAESHSTLYHHRPDEQRHVSSAGYRFRRLTSRVVGKLGVLAGVPSRWLQTVSEKINPDPFAGDR